MNTEQDRMKAAEIARRFAKYQSEDLVPQSDKDLLAFFQSWKFIIGLGSFLLIALLVRAGVFQ